MRVSLEVGVDWDTLVKQRSWCRVRANLVELTSRAGRHSGAKIQSCIFCGEACGNPVKHVIGKCRVFTTARDEFKRRSPGTENPEEITLAVLRERPRKASYKAAVELCAKVDRSARQYWSDVLQ